jgi:hypothetical protein
MASLCFLPVNSNAKYFSCATMCGEADTKFLCTHFQSLQGIQGQLLQQQIQQLQIQQLQQAQHQRQLQEQQQQIHQQQQHQAQAHPSATAQSAGKVAGFQAFELPQVSTDVLATQTSHTL